MRIAGNGASSRASCSTTPASRRDRFGAAATNTTPPPRVRSPVSSRSTKRSPGNATTGPRVSTSCANAEARGCNLVDAAEPHDARRRVGGSEVKAHAILRAERAARGRPDLDARIEARGLGVDPRVDHGLATRDRVLPDRRRD